MKFLLLVVLLGITGCSDERVDGDKKILLSLQGMKKPINIKDPEIIKMLCGSAGSGYIRSTEYLVNAGVDANSKCGRANAPILLHALGMSWTRKTGQLAKLCSHLLNWLSEGASHGTIS